MRRNDQFRYVGDTSFQIDNPTMLILHAYVLKFPIWNFNFENIRISLNQIELFYLNLTS